MKNNAIQFNDNAAATVHNQTAAIPPMFDNALDALQHTAPKGSAVVTIGFDNLDIFLRAGYRVTTQDAADTVVARGGEREFSKARALGKKTVLCPTHAYFAAACAPYRTLDRDFATITVSAPPDAVAFDCADVHNNLASILGEIAALDLCAFDSCFAAHMRGEPYDDKPQKAIAELISDTVTALKGKEKLRSAAETILCSAGKRAASIIATHPELLHSSGAAQMSEALRMLYSAEERPLAMRGETEFVLCTYITDFYIKNISTDKIYFPPDNNRRIDSVCEYFKTDLRRACVYAAPVYPPIKMRLCEYRRDEFKSEHIKLLCDIKRRQAAAWHVFKRLYPDDGYSIKTLVDNSDLGICLALAPDVFAGDTMLSFIKQTGKLDKYIV